MYFIRSLQRTVLRGYCPLQLYPLRQGHQIVSLQRCKFHQTAAKMVKSDDDVIQEFNEYVNMTPDELEEWLSGDSSQSAGWDKEDGSGESVGHESGRKIIEILKKNPKKDAGNYDEDDLAHMRKVAAYCKRHLAQEGSAKKDPNSKSARSLKNWGHDPQKS